MLLTVYTTIQKNTYYYAVLYKCPKFKGPSIIFSLYVSVQIVLFFLTPSLLHKAYCINVDTMYSIYTMIINHFYKRTRDLTPSRLGVPFVLLRKG